MVIVIVIILVFIVAKFVYDTYLTNNTEHDFETYRKKDPISAAQIERPKTEEQYNDLLNAINNEIVNDQRVTIDKNKPSLKMRGYQILADDFGCEIDEVRRTYFHSLKNEKYSSYAIFCFVSQFEKEMKVESVKYDLDPENTPAAILKALTKEYISLSQYDYYMTTALKLISEGKSILEAQRIIKEQIEDFPDKYKIIRDSLLHDQPAELLLNRAIDLIYEENNFIGALSLIDKALNLDDPKTNLKLHSLKEEVLSKISECEDNEEIE